MSQYAPCIECGSTNFHDADDGYTYCPNGHLQQGTLRTGEDDGDYGTAGKMSRKKEVREKIKITKVYRGVKGYRLFLQSWQLILWKQCYVLIHRKGMPAELWDIVRELWTLRLTELTPRYDDPPNADNDGNQSAVPPTSEPGTDVEGVRQVDHLKSNKKARDSPALSDTVALICLGLLLLQQPFSLAAIYDLIRDEEICYIRAIRHVPQDMRERLPSEYHESLDTTTIPSPEILQLAVYRTATMYNVTFGMTVPALNWKLLLFERIEMLALPLQIFSTVQHLALMTEFDFSYPLVFSKRRSATAFPEAQLMSLIVIATKLLFPFDADSIPRYPVSLSEPAAISIDWPAWLETKRRFIHRVDSSKELSARQALEVTDHTIATMSNDQLDQYMDWFQRAYAQDVKGSAVQQQILNMFPTKVLPEIESNKPNNGLYSLDQERFRATQSCLRPCVVVSDEDDLNQESTIQRPGDSYQRFDRREDLSGTALAFHLEAAQLGCLELDGLLAAVRRAENLLFRHQHEKRRADMFEVSSGQAAN